MLGSKLLQIDRERIDCGDSWLISLVLSHSYDSGPDSCGPGPQWILTRRNLSQM